jgi:hypothetical protein
MFVVGEETIQTASAITHDNFALTDAYGERTVFQADGVGSVLPLPLNDH